MVIAPFSGVGDVITTASLIKSLVDALDESRGSAAEYRRNKEKLWQLNHQLLEIERYYEEDVASKSFSGPDSSDSSAEVIVKLASQCRERIDDFLKSIRKYEPSLKAGGTGSRWRDAPKKIEWQVRCSKRLSKFWQEEVRGDCLFLSMLLNFNSE